MISYLNFVENTLEMYFDGNPIECGSEWCWVLNHKADITIHGQCTGNNGLDGAQIDGLTALNLSCPGAHSNSKHKKSLLTI